MPNPLPLEIRTRIVDAYENGEGTYKEVAVRFKVSTSSVSRLLARARADRLEADVKGPTPHTRKLKAPHLAFLRAAIEDVPDSSAPELVAALFEEFGLIVSEATVKRERRRMGFTPKKGGPVGIELERPDVIEKRRAWTLLQPHLDSSRLVFLDETGSNAAMSRRTAWASRGQRVSLPRPTFSSNVSVISAIALDGVRGTMAIRGAIDGDAFLAYLKAVLCPRLRPGDILVMDNLRVHKVAGDSEAVEAVGASVLYQPAYSPDFNPIEMT